MSTMQCQPLHTHINVCFGHERLPADCGTLGFKTLTSYMHPLHHSWSTSAGQQLVVLWAPRQVLSWGH